MTQEELDALMAGDLEEMGDETAEVSAVETTSFDLETSDDDIDEKIEEESPKEAHEYRASATISWPPPPPTEAVTSIPLHSCP